MKKSLLCAFLLSLLTAQAFSQTDRFWSANNTGRSSMATDKGVARLSFPKAFKLFNLDFNAFKNEVLTIADGRPGKKSTIITLPNANGKLEQFEIFEASNFAPSLQAQFPGIRAYSGKGITDRYATLKLSISPQGIQTMVFRTDSDNEFMEPYSADHKVYAVYNAHRDKGSLPWNCSTEDQVTVTGLGKKINLLHLANRSTGDLKTMRLAQSVTAEYSNYFGATSAAQVGLVLAAINATLTRCNGVYEKDLALHLNLIDSTSKVIYYNASTDPYDAAAAGAGGTWNAQLQSTLTSVIGDANYDIGHLFGASGGGGNAGCIGCICATGKGSGFTSPADAIPQGDNFDIDYVVHEVGHQLGANHTFSYSNEGSGVNKELGSGITIMGYAGITSYDLAAHSFDFYHQASVSQIQANLGTVSCPVTEAIMNATPVVAPVGNYTIPKSTPFALTGVATDADNDPLTYCWEQNDNTTTTGANSIAKIGKATGPNWISFKPTASPTRLFPRLQTILAGKDTTGVLLGGDAVVRTEALSSVARTLNFRLTVRDNHPYSSTPPADAGQTQYTDMTVTVNAGAGPFTVTSPNTAMTWTAGTCQTVTWNVANTNAAPINCATVNVELSDDGGQTFPYMLAANVPNNGSAQVSLPQSINTTQARVRVSSIGNIFFDIDNADFSVVPASYPQYAMCTPNPASLCENTSANVVINTTSLVGFTSPITFSATGNPAGSNVTFSPNPVTPGNPVTVTFQGAFLAGSYTVAVTGIADTVSRTVNTVFNVVAAAAIPILTTPADNETGVSILPVYTWSASPNVGSYTLEVADNAGFLPVLHTYTGITGSSFTTPASDALTENMDYFWRLTPDNACGTGPTSVINHFKTYLTVCNPAENSTDVPKTISATGKPTVTSTMTVSAPGNILDVDVVGLNVTHTWIADLGIQLLHGTAAAMLLNYACDDGSTNGYQNLDINYDDEAASATIPCPPTDGLTYRPVSPLSAFDNTNSSGTWTLRIKDTANQDGGSLNAWGLRICTALGNPLPVNWMSFTGHANENRTVTLQWSTANEVNNDHYEIERSTDGISFTKVGNIRAGNNANAVQNYFFNDLKPYTGANYYRLKQVDKDSRFQYSKIVKVMIVKASAMFTMYPNPVHDNSTVRMMKDVKELTLRLTDGLGRVVYINATGNATAGQEFTIPVKNLSRGVYVLTVSTSNETENRKVVVE